MANEITTARVEEHQQARAEDFEYAFQGAARGIAALDRLFMSARGCYLIGGRVSPAGGFSVKAAPLWANGAGAELPAFSAAGAGPVQAAPPGDAERIDTVQARGAFEPFDTQPRQFYDPERGGERTRNVSTKNRLVAKVEIKKGAEGAGRAPEADAGWVKLAEIRIKPGEAGLEAGDIANALEGGGSWTNEEGSVFAARSYAEFWAAFTARHAEDGGHRDRAIQARHIDFGTGAAQASGVNMPLGKSWGEGAGAFDAADSVFDALVKEAAGRRQADAEMGRRVDRRAPLASPRLTGTPRAPHPAQNADDDQIATARFVANAASALEPAIADGSLGLLMADFSGHRDSSIPRLLAGSRFELNGRVRLLTEDALPDNWAGITDGRWAYVYAQDNGVLRFSPTAPTFQAGRGGWYHPARDPGQRCLMACWRQSERVCRGKALMGARLFTPSRPYGRVGAQIRNAQARATVNIEAGWYAAALTGGTGGRGGDGGASGRWNGSNGAGAPRVNHAGQQGAPGGAGAAAQELTFFLYLEKGTAELVPGRTGGGGGGDDGGNGGDGADGGPSFLLNNGKVVATAPGGKGGAGGRGAAGSVGTSGAAPALTGRQAHFKTPYAPAEGPIPYAPGLASVYFQPGDTAAGKAANGGAGAAGKGFAAAVSGRVVLSVL